MPKRALFVFTTIIAGRGDVKLLDLESSSAYDDDIGAHLWYLQGKRFVTPAGDWPLDGLNSSQEKPNPFARLTENGVRGSKPSVIRLALLTQTTLREH